jgi:hypothetical protein
MGEEDQDKEGEDGGGDRRSLHGSMRCLRELKTTLERKCLVIATFATPLGILKEGKGAIPA